MRQHLLFCLVLGLATAGLSAQNATPSANTSGSSFSDPSPNSNSTPPPSADTSLLTTEPHPFANASDSALITDAPALAPQLPLAPPAETRTPAQLQAVLAAYVGHWQGNYAVHAPNGQELSNFTVDVVYVLKPDKDGLPVLTCTTSTISKSIKDGPPATEVTRSWVDHGQIVAQTLHGDAAANGSEVEKFFARTRGTDVVWFTGDADKADTDFSLTETLQLTPDGGTLASKGFERVPQSNPPILVYVTSDLKKLPK
jgi:hypothetical protein